MKGADLKNMTTINYFWFVEHGHLPFWFGNPIFPMGPMPGGPVTPEKYQRHLLFDSLRLEIT